MQTTTPAPAVASTSGAGVSGRPKKTHKLTKSTEVTAQKSNTSTVVEGGKEPGKPEQTPPTTTTAASADSTVVQDDSLDVN